MNLKDENLPINDNTFLGFAFHIWSGSFTKLESRIIVIEGFTKTLNQQVNFRLKTARLVLFYETYWHLQAAQFNT